MKEKQYTYGFNHGYLLAKYLPDLLLIIIKDLKPDNSYLDGLFSGQAEYEVEKSKDRLKDLTILRTQSKSRGKNRER